MSRLKQMMFTSPVQSSPVCNVSNLALQVVLSVVYIALGLTSMECMSRLEQMMFISSVQFSSVWMIRDARDAEGVLLCPSNLLRCKWYYLAGRTGTLTAEEIKIAKAAWRRFCHSVHVE